MRNIGKSAPIGANPLIKFQNKGVPMRNMGKTAPHTRVNKENLNKKKE